MKKLQSLVFFAFISSGVAALASSDRVVIAAPKLSIESNQISASLEKRSSIWALTSQRSSTREVESYLFKEADEVERLQQSFDEIRNWALETVPNLKIDSKSSCQDIKILISGAFTRNLRLCSSLQAHRVFADTFYSKLRASSR
jgi:hypothetical protein